MAYFSSTLAILLTYPSDTVRRRMICAQKKSKYTGFFDCLARIYQKEGLKSFFRGGPVIFLQSLSSSIVLYSYDKLAADGRKLQWKKILYSLILILNIFWWLFNENLIVIMPYLRKQLLIKNWMKSIRKQKNYFKLFS